MSFGIVNATNISIENITSLVNVTEPTSFFININNVVYDGYLTFILLNLLGIILFLRAQKNEDQPLPNAMVALTVISVIGMFVRVIYIVQNGVVVGLITDFLLWIHPLCSVILATIIYATKDN